MGYAAHFKHIKMNKPVIAAVNGMCMGGGFEIMLGTDIRVASEKAVFAASRGVTGNSSGGRYSCKAGQTDTFCKYHGADTDGRKDKRRKSFLDMGVLNYVVEQDKVMDKAMEIARKFLSLSTTAVQIAKESVIALREMPLEQAFNTEAMPLGYKAFTGEDAKEGLRRFLQ